MYMKGNQYHMACKVRKQSPRQSHAESQDDVEFIAQYIIETSGKAGNAVRKGEVDRASNLFAEVNNTLRMIEQKGVSKTANTIRVQTVLDDLLVAVGKYVVLELSDKLNTLVLFKNIDVHKLVFSIGNVEVVVPRDCEILVNLDTLITIKVTEVYEKEDDTYYPEDD